MRQPVRTDDRQGVTLIELIIVVAIIGLLAALALPNMSSWIQQMRIKSAAVGVERSITLARKRAVTTGQRHCVVINQDGSYSNNNDDDYLIDIVVSSETAPGSALWTPVTTPELDGVLNDPSTRLWPGVTLEDGGDTTDINGLDSCAGLIFNRSGYLDNPIGDFPVDCGGAQCVRATLRLKGTSPLQQRALWIDRGGNVRVSQTPGIVPSF